MANNDLTEMEFYNCRVRLAGQITHDVPRARVSQREVTLLRAIHGPDAIIELKAVDVVEYTRPQLEEHYMELAREYGRYRVEEALGVTLDRFEEWLTGKLDEQANATEERIAASEQRFREQQKQPAAAQA